ncbi:beta-lactamase family protein [Streptomyces sp. NBC_01003]|uniref:serine hydrolase domain-containing protein n=1 Tax=Streptomyces sp. NBC_01003 TaxID=2903714 RepID=UPI00386559E9|nr:beta-lactamase family protein [Streptomyces sp. NBC_01003]
MPARTRRTVLASALVLGLAAGPLAVPALADAPARASAPADRPDGAALREAISGLPNADATAALVRVGGTDGTWRGSSGVRDLASGRAALDGGRFRAGSTTKVVTAAVVLQLAAERRVNLDTPVQHYLPDLFKGKGFRPISVRQLLNHTSGIQAGDGFGDDFDDAYAHRFDTLTPQAVVASALAKGPSFDPGGRQQYLNINYTVLGMLIEKVTGHTYADEATRRVLRPAGMRATSFPGADPVIHGPHNRGYQLAGGRFVDVTEWNQSDRWAAGDMISTTADLERLLRALFGGRLVPGPQLEEMFTVPSDVPGATMSAGLQRLEAGGSVYWGKSGSRYGYVTGVAATRDLSRTVVYSVGATDAKGDAMNPVAERIIMAAVKG